MSWLHTNTTVEDICSSIELCTQVSFYNNTLGTFVTYTASTPTVNNMTRINTSDPVLIYVSDDDNLIMNYNVPGGGQPRENMSIENTSWNTLSLFNAANMTSMLNYTDVGSYTGNVTWATKYNGTKYITCSSVMNMCASTPKTPTNINFTLGDAMWVLPDGNMTINRSEVSL